MSERVSNGVHYCEGECCPWCRVQFLEARVKELEEWIRREIKAHGEPVAMLNGEVLLRVLLGEER